MRIWVRHKNEPMSDMGFQKCGDVLGGSWVVISRVISMVNLPVTAFRVPNNPTNDYP